MKHKHRNIAIVAALCAGVLVPLGSTATASATPKALGTIDNPTQTIGSAVRYGTSAPLPITAAAPTNASQARDTQTSATRLRHSAGRAVPGLATPKPQGTPVVSDPGAASGFAGLTHADQRLAGTGAYANTQFSLEPPDQGLCAGNGFVIEPINTAFAVYTDSGTKLTATTAINQFFNRAPSIDRVTGVRGDDLGDPRCYYDPVGQRFFQTVFEIDAPGIFDGVDPVNGTHVLVAVSQTSDPTGAWNLYSVDTTDNGTDGTPVHTGCPCLPDQPLLGANRDGVFIDTNQFENVPAENFNGAQLYALGRAALESGASSVTFDHINLGTVPTGDPASPLWGSVQPSASADPGSGTELMLSGGPEDGFQNIAALDDRIAAWALSGTGSLATAAPHLQVSHQVLTSETYGVAGNVGAVQKDGPTPLRDQLNAPPTNANEPLETINSNDSRMNQVTDFHGLLLSGTNTAVTSASGPPRVGIAYFAVFAVGTPAGVIAHIASQGYVAADNENVLFPSIAVDHAGIGALAFTLTGPDFFPSAAYVRFVLGRAVGAIHISAAGQLPEDGFTGYAALGGPVDGVSRWGDYSAATYADGAIWMGNEYIPNAPRTTFADWGTFVTRLPAG